MRPPTPEIAALLAELESEPAVPDPWLERLGPRLAGWLAVIPQWSADMAEAVGLPLPKEFGSAGELRRALNEGGLLRRRQDFTAAGRPVELFWVDELTRRAWAADLAGAGTDLESELAALVVHLRLASSRMRGPLPSPTQGLMDLLESDAGSSGQALVQEVTALVSQDDLAVAAGLIDTAAGVAPIRGGAYPAAVVRARRMLYLGHRRRRDREALAGFVRRRDQIRPVLDLMRAGPGDPWALHLIGPGGVGKTMLVRYLASDLLREEYRLPRFAVARVDFDHISPDYPVVRPVQLLTELADELAWHAQEALSHRALESFRHAAAEVDAEAADSAASRGDRLIGEAVARFSSFVDSLPGPQLLVLDTCEELAKLHPAGVEVPAVERTFELLQQVHESCPSVRVLFAGRRYLAPSGHGWAIPDAVSQRSVVGLAPRGFLALEEIRGFDSDEAREVLGAPHPRTGQVPDPELVETVLARGPEMGSEARPPEPGRYNPFVLAHFRAWWEDEPELSADAIGAAGPDAYVEARILGRLRDREIEELIPAVVFLGEMDEEMLACAAPAGAEETLVRRLFELLAEQEWVRVSFDELSGLGVLHVSEGLRPLLEAWGSRPESQRKILAARARLARPLRTRLEEAPLGRLTAQLVVAALRTYERGEAAVAWARVEERIERERRWDWATAVLPAVRFGLEAEFVDDPLLDAAVSATEIAVRSRQASGADAQEHWGRVLGLIERTGSLAGEAWRLARRLTERARLGQLRTRTTDVRAISHWLWAASGPVAPAASVVSALEAQLLPAVEDADVGVVGGADGRGVSRPRGRVPGGAWSSRWRADRHGGGGVFIRR